uniref:Uncharacterized protein n=1 Tax=Anguilla anguilla TaxID=7936 RepID=A0A0E9XI69_ANGAN
MKVEIFCISKNPLRRTKMLTRLSIIETHNCTKQLVTWFPVV